MVLSSLEAETDRIKRTKHDWDKIMNLTNNVKMISDNSFEDYGEVCAPPEVVADLSLDE